MAAALGFSCLVAWASYKHHRSLLIFVAVLMSIGLALICFDPYVNLGSMVVNAIAVAAVVTQAEFVF